MDLQLKGKTVLITGGSKGIGLACGHGFAAEGANVILAARSPELLAEGAKAISAKYPVKVETKVVDLRDGKALVKLADECAHADVLVNNAGDIPGGSIETLDEEKWRHAWELKVFGFVNLTREMIKLMKARKSGVIVNVIGMAGENPNYEYVCGATANAGLAAFTKGLGRGTTDFGVRVVGVHPPATRTDRITKVMKAAAKARYGDETKLDELIRDKLFTRPIEPEQVADSIVYLASARASHLSGVMLNLGNA